MVFRSAAKAFLSLSGTYFNVFLTWCTIQRWYSVFGKAAAGDTGGTDLRRKEIHRAVIQQAVPLRFPRAVPRGYVAIVVQAEPVQSANQQGKQKEQADSPCQKRHSAARFSVRRTHTAPPADVSLPGISRVSSPR